MTTGCGIPAERLEDIFDLFSQGDSKIDRADGGMGVGLTLVRSLVTLHGGTVRARSEGRGKGSVFEVRLPLADNLADNGAAAEPPIAGERVRSVSSNGGSSAPSDILVIEDNVDARETLKALLELDGHRVRVAGDGKAGLEVIEQWSPAIALVDIGLPVIDGYELIRAIRARRLDRGLRLVALTGYGRPEDRRAVEKAGFDFHLVKPVSLEALRAACNLRQAALT
jgi:CheY-like chemotaxis protein